MDSKQKFQFDWIDALKAIAIIGIIMVHFVEALGFFPIFTSPSYDWPPLSERISSIFPSTGNVFFNTVIFLSWLGDYGPGIFILLSGFTLTLSALKKEKTTLEFYRQRLLRIYPLYITIHIIVLFFVIYFFKWDTEFFSLYNLISLSGFRFVDSLFFYINPSWWFIWLILQLYLVFPFLLKYLKQFGNSSFLLLTLAITLLSRTLGLLGITYSDSLMNWMMGIFAGTRLFEFTAGMILGLWIFEDNKSFRNFLSQPKKVFWVGTIVFVSGLAASITYAGSLFSLFLVSIGFTGLFYAIFQLPFFQKNYIKNPLRWIGRNSFSVFLLHQPFMMYAASVTGGVKLIVLLFSIVIVSFMVGSVIENFVNSNLDLFLEKTNKIKELAQKRIKINPVLYLIIAAGIFSFFVPLIQLPQFFNKFLKLFLLFLILLIFLLREKQNFRKDLIISRFFDFSIIASASYVVLLGNWFQLFGVFLLLGFIFILITSRINYFISVPLSVAAVIFFTIGAEIYLTKKKPIEVLQWGELPALQIDEITGYGLIPNQETRLKYNNYNYILRTNSIGLASPEINLEKNENEIRIFIIGDAFTMPEGVEYEHAYPYLLEKQLRELIPDKKVTVINGGVTGFGPNEFLAQLEKYIDTIKPDLIVNQFFVNEFEEVNLEVSERNVNAGFFLKDHKRDYYFGNAQVPAHFKKTIQSLFGGEARYNDWKSLQILYQKEGPYLQDTVLIKLDGYFEKITALSSAKNASLLIMFVPGEIAVSSPSHIAYYPYHLDLSDTTVYDLNLPNKIIESMCIDKGIPFFDVTQHLREHHVQPVYFPESWHWNKEGHKLVSQILAERIFTTFYH